MAIELEKLMNECKNFGRIIEVDLKSGDKVLGKLAGIKFDRSAEKPTPTGIYITDRLYLLKNIRDYRFRK